MSRLAQALQEVTQELSGDELHEIIGGSRATAHRRLRELRETGSIKRWAALSVELLARWDKQKRGAQTIGEALCAEGQGDCRDSPASPDDIKLQNEQVVRKTSSLNLGLHSVSSTDQLDAPRVRVVYSKAEAAMTESSKQCSMLKNLMRSLRNRMKYGSSARGSD